MTGFYNIKKASENKGSILENTSGEYLTFHLPTRKIFLNFVEQKEIYVSSFEGISCSEYKITIKNIGLKGSYPSLQKQKRIINKMNEQKETKTMNNNQKQNPHSTDSK